MAFGDLMKEKALCSIEVSSGNWEIGCGICSSIIPAQIHATSICEKYMNISDFETK